RGHSPSSNRPGNHADCAQTVQSASLEVLAGDVLESLPAGPEIDPIADFGVSGHRPHLWIQEMRHHARDCVRSNDGISIYADENLCVTKVREAEIEGVGFARVGLGQDHYPPARFFVVEQVVCDL